MLQGTDAKFKINSIVISALSKIYMVYMNIYDFHFVEN